MVQPQKGHRGSYFSISKIVLFDLRHIFMCEVGMEDILFDDLALASIARWPAFHSFS